MCVIFWVIIIQWKKVCQFSESWNIWSEWSACVWGRFVGEMVFVLCVCTARPLSCVSGNKMRSDKSSYKNAGKRETRIVWSDLTNVTWSVTNTSFQATSTFVAICYSCATDNRNHRDVKFSPAGKACYGCALCHFRPYCSPPPTPLADPHHPHHHPGIERLK